MEATTSVSYSRPIAISFDSLMRMSCLPPVAGLVAQPAVARAARSSGVEARIDLSPSTSSRKIHRRRRKRVPFQLSPPSHRQPVRADGPRASVTARLKQQVGTARAGSTGRSEGEDDPHLGGEVRRVLGKA